MIEDNRKAIHEAMKEDLGQGSFVVDFANVCPRLAPNFMDMTDLTIARTRVE